MFEMSMYNSWQSRILFYIKATRPKTYAELSEAEKLQDDFDLSAMNIVLQGTELSYQECECMLYNDFDKFASIKGETLYEYYMRFAQLMNDLHWNDNAASTS
ncbi:hypothetical protein Tco_0741282 [Tanacetum coccineum]